MSANNLNNDHQLIDMIAKSCLITSSQVHAAIKLLDSGNTVPFIARYRKEQTNALDDTQLRNLENKLQYFRELNLRKASILKAIEKQGKLTTSIKKNIALIEDKATLEHVYVPFKITKVNKAKMASDAGLSILSEQLWQSPKQNLTKVAIGYINTSKGYDTAEQVLDGAMAIAVEKIVQDIELVSDLKSHLFQQARLTSSVVKSKVADAVKFKDYFDFSARLNRLPAHRVLALLRGKSEGYLRLKLNADPFNQNKKDYSYCQTLIAKHLNIFLDKTDNTSWHRLVIDNAWRLKLLPSLEKQLLIKLKEQADLEAIDQFANNLSALLLAAPAGEKVTLGLDPGFRSGCKLAVIDKNGAVLSTGTIYPHHPQAQLTKSEQIVEGLLKRYQVELIAIGNGTASRESEQFINKILNNISSDIKSISVSEAGASVYSASQLAADEFPELDVTLRGAISIARRLQDPLSELVKIEAKSIGVGLYQHDVEQKLLAGRLEAVVEDCVNKVGVDLNTASAYLLTQVAGLNSNIAKNIVAYRDANGRFNSRQSLLNVPRLGEKAFEQAAGFLIVKGGNNCLDETILHPEQYALAEKLISLNKKTVNQVVKNVNITSLLIPESDDVCSSVNTSAMHEILNILKQVRRDPRTEFITADFDQKINKISDLEPGMDLQGIVSNVANFGAFIDLGVHQDGLVHISMLSDNFVDDPHKFIKVGQIVNVKVVSVDIERKRIALTMKSIVQPSI